MDITQPRPGLGWIEVIAGSMFSGKSEELIRRLRRAEIALRVALKNPDRLQIDEPLVQELVRLRDLVRPDEILLATKVEYESKLTFDEVADAINATEANIREAVPATKLIYIEPDFKRPVGAD